MNITMDMDDHEHELSFFNSTDLTNSTAPEDIAYEVEKYSLLLLILLVAIVGLLGNGTLVYILRKHCARNAENTYILNLAVADLAFILFFIPFTDLYKIFSAHYPFGIVTCKITESIDEIALGVSAFTLIAMSAHSVSNRGETEGSLRSRRSNRNAVVSVAVIWLVAVVCAIPTLWFAAAIETPDHVNGDITMCVSSTNDIIGLGPFRLCVYYLVPLATVGFFLTVAQLNRTSNASSLAVKEFSNLVCVLFTVYVVFFSLDNLTSLRFMIFETDYTWYWHIFHLLVHYWTFVYRCANPVALYFTSDTFRKHFNRFLFCWCRARNREPVPDLELPLQGTGQNNWC